MFFMVGRLKNWHDGLTTVGKVLLWSITTVIIGGVISASASPSPSGQSSNSSATSSQSAEEKKMVTETETIPFGKTSVNDADIESGKTAVRTAGVNGSKNVIYEVTYRDGVEISRVIVKETVISNPITEVTAIGTKKYSTPVSSCSGGYINSSGNCVQSPGDSPSGASARCSDGTYSYSQSRRGTCSHHGGVAQWL